MASFEDLQRAFLAQECRTLGLDPATTQEFQPAWVPPVGSDTDLWAAFDTIPGPGPLLVPTGQSFFTQYATLIDGLVPASSNPLDPIRSAQQKLKAWGAAPPTWSVGYAGFVAALGNAPSHSVDFAQSAATDPGYWGLWGRAAPLQGPSDQFAAGAVTVNAAFAHVLVFAPAPGNWYVSSALSLAYRTQTGSIWPSDGSITWSQFFGPSGTLTRAVAALYAVAGTNLTAGSSTVFPAAVRGAISAGAHNGLWPHYLATSTPQFSASGELTVTATTSATNPTVLFATVLPIGQYLGA